MDASQLETFEPCPRKWFYQYKQNLIPNRSRRNFDIGSYYHEVLAHFYSLPFTGICDFIAKQRSAIEFSQDAELLNKYNIKDLEEIRFHRKRLIDYFNKYADEDETHQPIAVEEGFSWLLDEGINHRYILEGKIDYVFKAQPYGLTVMDHKTQSRKDDRWEFNHQVCNYLSFTRANYFIYNYIGLQDSLPKDGIRRMIYKPHEGMLDQWKKEVKNTFDEMYRSLTGNGDLKNEIEAFQRRRSVCDSSKYGLCPYHKLCSVPDDSKWVNVVKSAYKEKEERWTAWKSPISLL